MAIGTDPDRYSNATPATGILFIERHFNAPRDLVWKAWTEPEHIKQWWGPKNFTAPYATVDFRVGGSYLFCMRSPEGQDFWSAGEYREIVEPERIVYTDYFADAEGNKVSPEQYGMGGDWADELVVTLTFEEVGENKTRMRLRHTGMPPGEMSKMAEAGWNQSLDKMAEYVERGNAE